MKALCHEHPHKDHRLNDVTDEKQMTLEQLTLSSDEVHRIVNSAIWIKTTAATHVREKTRPTVDEVMSWFMNAESIANIICRAAQVQVGAESLGPKNDD
jgi:hypothetical protein